MWLLAAAPTVSRVLPMLVAADTAALVMHHGDHVMAMPGMMGMEMPDMGAMPMPTKPDLPGDPMQHMDECGYCVMLAHTPLLSGGVIALLIGAPMPAVAPVMAASASWRPQPLLSAHPRGPPSVQTA